jgi:hypothetical protein
MEWNSGVGVIIKQSQDLEKLRDEENNRLKNINYANRIKSISHKEGDEITVKFEIKDSFKSNLFYGLMFSKDKEIIQEILGAKVKAIGWNHLDNEQLMSRLEEIIEISNNSYTPEIRAMNRLLYNLFQEIKNGQLSKHSLLGEEETNND